MDATVITGKKKQAIAYSNYRESVDHNKKILGFHSECAYEQKIRELDDAATEAWYKEEEEGDNDEIIDNF